MYSYRQDTESVNDEKDKMKRSVQHWFSDQGGETLDSKAVSNYIRPEGTGFWGKPYSIGTSKAAEKRLFYCAEMISVTVLS